jgi:phosphopantothenoylcysteine decarboxylase/phosphopantothenate--cysteine ligase
MTVRTILTKGGAEFVTPLSISSLSGEKTFQELFDLTDETEMGHIKLSRDADLVLVAPATADLIAKMAQGLAPDLATTALLATDKPVMLAPTMNTQMWQHEATQRNLKQLRADGIELIPPAAGDLACGEVGEGRLAEVDDIIANLQDFFLKKYNGSSLTGKHILITAGPTHEAIDPVRYIANQSSGKQGYALAQALANKGAAVTLISGPTALETPEGVKRINVISAEEMREACEKSLPADIGIFVAAVCDWRPESTSDQKIKKQNGGMPVLNWVENTDILKKISNLEKNRPELVIGFAAETTNLIEHAKAKLARKGCDWIIANDVSVKEGVSVMGGDENSPHLITKDSHDEWPTISKKEAAEILAVKIEEYFTYN